MIYDIDFAFFITVKVAFEFPYPLSSISIPFAVYEDALTCQFFLKRIDSPVYRYPQEVKMRTLRNNIVHIIGLIQKSKGYGILLPVITFE